MRCSTKSFKVVRNMFTGEGNDSQIVTLTPHAQLHKKIKNHNLPEEITVRCVRVQLETGEYEILVTNLLDT